MKKLRVAILWHHHQPYYRCQEEFVLPWVRLHAVKDYLDVAALHFEFPSLKLTYNIVPSLLMQLAEYQQGVCDTVLRLTDVKADELTIQQKRDILARFFLCHVPTMIEPHVRYKELHDRGLDVEKALSEFQSQDWLDLQVWYNLTWFGPLSRQQQSIARLILKGSGFTEEDKAIVLAHHRIILRAVVPTLQELYNSGVAELTMSPLFHPIMPLLDDTNSALEASPEIALPTKRYRQAHDAEWQLLRGEQIFKDAMNTAPSGVWCSEGSLSDASLHLLAQSGFKWTATDEQVLKQSSPHEYRESDKYFMHRFAVDRRPAINVFFRDHSLSDAIGFVYQSWNAEHAADDFMNRLHGIRELIIKERGDDAIENAVVPIILDGENCWEFYPDNGLPFLRALYRRLSEDEGIRTCTFQQATQELQVSEHETLQHIVAGSWIYGNFKMWIGHAEKNKAWDLLHAARILIDAKRVTKKQWKDAMQHIYIAEGSDWFWWYGDDHQAVSRHVFDELFRYHLQQIYIIYLEPIPADLLEPIMQMRETTSTFSTMHAFDAG